MKNQKKKTNQLTTAASKQTHQPFIAHLGELRQRLFYIVAAIVFFGVVGYFIQEHIVTILLRPARQQQFIYTSPGGGLNFLVNICISFGVAVSVPLIMYHLFRFLEPLLRHDSRRFIVVSGLASTILAALGALFGYFIGLPAALAFLLHQFRTTQIQPLLTIQEYVSFVMVYIIGFALLFQIPLILLFINRITRLKPGKLFGYQRFVITGAFILAAVITPSGDAINQLIMAGPIIAMYQLGIISVWLYNRHSKYDKFTELRTRDAQVQILRQTQLQQARPFQAEPLAVHAVQPIPGAARTAPRPASRTARAWPDTTPLPRARIASFQDIRPQAVSSRRFS